jgi:metal-responsive CopG/Arc/MetJ family transcriptional regulator
MNEETTQEFISVQMPTEMVKQVEQMAKEDDTDRSKLIRYLIRKEAKRRERRKEVTTKIAQTTH